MVASYRLILQCLAGGVQEDIAHQLKGAGRLIVAQAPAGIADQTGGQIVPAEDYRQAALVSKSPQTWLARIGQRRPNRPAVRDLFDGRADLRVNRVPGRNKAIPAIRKDLTELLGHSGGKGLAPASGSGLKMPPQATIATFNVSAGVNAPTFGQGLTPRYRSEPLSVT